MNTFYKTNVCWNIHTKFKMNVSWMVIFSWNTGKKNAQLVKSRKLYFFETQNTVNIVLGNNISCFSVEHSHQPNNNNKKKRMYLLFEKVLSKCLSKKCAYEQNKWNYILTHHQSHSHLIKYVFVVSWRCNDTTCCLLLFNKIHTQALQFLLQGTLFSTYKIKFFTMTFSKVFAKHCSMVFMSEMSPKILQMTLIGKTMLK